MIARFIPLSSGTSIMIATCERDRARNDKRVSTMPERVLGVVTRTSDFSSSRGKSTEDLADFTWNCRSIVEEVMAERVGNSCRARTAADLPDDAFDVRFCRIETDEECLGDFAIGA